MNDLQASDPIRRVALLGNRELAVDILHQLLAVGGMEVFVVLNLSDSGNDDAAGRSLLKTARQLGVEHIQPSTINESQAAAQLASFAPQLAISCSYARIIAKKVMSIPAFAFVNFHYSLLPRHQGCYPIIWALALEDKETGVTLHVLDHTIDGGDILMNDVMAVPRGATAQEMNSQLSRRGMQLFHRFWAALEAGAAIPRRVQDSQAMLYHRLYHPFNRWIPWHLDAPKVAAVINALTFFPHPSGRTLLSGREIGILGPARYNSGDDGEAGQVQLIDGQPMVCCRQGRVRIEQIRIGDDCQPAAGFLDPRSRFHSPPVEEYPT